MSGSQEVKMLSYDMLLTHTCQEEFGRSSPVKKGVGAKRSRSIEERKQVKCSKSVQGPLYNLSANKHSSEASRSLRSLKYSVDVEKRKEESIDVEESFHRMLHDARREQMVQSVQDYETPAARKRRHMLIILQMPNYKHFMQKIASARRRRIFSQAVAIWKSVMLGLRALDKIVYGKKLDAARRIQKSWRSYQHFKKCQLKKHAARKAQLQREKLANSTIQREIRKFIKRRIAKKIVNDRRAHRRRVATIKLQAFCRGFSCRKWRAEQLRLLLLQDLHNWAGGNVLKLLERPRQLDIHTEDLVRKAIYLATNKTLPKQPHRPIKLLRMFRKRIKIAREIDEANARALKIEYENMMRERALMAVNDNEDLFKRHYRNVMAELEKQSIALQIKKKEREKEEEYRRAMRAEVSNVIEMKKLEEIVERSEREKMFREEYVLRRVELSIKNEKNRKHNVNIELMKQEDSLASKIRDFERNNVNQERDILSEQMKVKALLQNEAKKNAEKTGIVKQIEDVTPFLKVKNETPDEIIDMISKGFANEKCPHEILCQCDNKWTGDLKVMKACAANIDSVVREVLRRSNHVLSLCGHLRCFETPFKSAKEYLSARKRIKKLPQSIDFEWKPDRNCVQKYCDIKELQSLRKKRRDNICFIEKKGSQFSSVHKELQEVRHNLRVGKFRSRRERQEVLSKAIHLENEMEDIESSILSTCLSICEDGKVEKMHFLNLFRVHIHSDGRERGSSDGAAGAARRTKTPGYMQERKKAGPVIVSSTNKYADKTKIALSSSGDIEEIADEEGDSEVDDEELSCPSACTFSPKGSDQIVVSEMPPSLPAFSILHFHNTRTEVEEHEAKKKTQASLNRQSPQGRRARQSMSNFNTISLDQSESRRKPRKSISSQGNSNSLEIVSKKKSLLTHSLSSNVIDLEIDKAIPKEVSRSIPGLSKYTNEQSNLYLPIIRIAEIKKWSAETSRWYEDVESKWKAVKSSLCLSFLQRAKMLLHGKERYTRLQADDTSFQLLLRSADVLDLVELLCCRRSLIMRPTTNESYIGIEMLLPSRKLDALCGRHPFSLQTYFSLQLSNLQYKRDKRVSVEAWAGVSSDLYSENSLFRRLGLLSLEQRLARDRFTCDKISDCRVKWGNMGVQESNATTQSTDSSNSSSLLKDRIAKFKQKAAKKVNADKHENDLRRSENVLSREWLYLSHIIAIDLYGSLIVGLECERAEDSSFLSSLLHEENLILHEVQNKEFKLLRLSGHLNNNKSLQMKSKLHLGFSPVYSVANLVQSYRSIQANKNFGDDVPLKSSKFVPGWMLPINYWGKPPKSKKGSSTNEELDEDVYDFEEKVTNWAQNVYNTLKKKANDRILKKRNEIEEYVMKINIQHMGYEDKLSSTVREEQERENMLKTRRDWEKKNGGWYRRFMNFVMRKNVESIHPFDEKRSLQDLEHSITRLRFLKEHLPNQTLPQGWTKCFTPLIEKPFYDVAEARRQRELRVSHQSGFRLKRQSTAAVPAHSVRSSAQRPHIRWMQTVSSKYKKTILARHMQSNLGEMVVCGGIRCIILMARVIVDEKVQPQGLPMLECISLNGQKSFEVIDSVKSARICFQNRPLCEATFLKFAVTMSQRKQPVSELGLRLLRIDLPHSELQTVKLKRRHLWTVFKELRYNSVTVLGTVTKIQSILRRRMAVKLANKMRLQNKRKNAKQVHS